MGRMLFAPDQKPAQDNPADFEYLDQEKGTDV
jgi:hypothetical protein